MCSEFREPKAGDIISIVAHDGVKRVYIVSNKTHEFGMTTYHLIGDPENADSQGRADPATEGDS